MRVALIDQDEVCYRIALRYQRVWYCVTIADKVLYRFPSKLEAIESIGNRQDLDIIQEVEGLPPNGMEDVLDTIISGILLETNSTNYKLYLSGKDNFRYKLATLVPYKGNRVNENKPLYLEYVRNLSRERGAEEISFLEGDDLLSSGVSLFKDCVVCSQDKDLATVPSLNFNTGKRILQTITPEMARYNFFKQLLIGDPTDNIPSPYLLGEVGATKFLQSLNSNYKEKDYYQAIHPFYFSWLAKKDKEGAFKTKWYTKDMNIHDILFEIGNLLWMHRTRDESERWNIPLEFKK